MIYLLLFFGVFFIFKGILLINGRTALVGLRRIRLIHERQVPFQDERTLRGWCYGTGVVHVLWGLCAVALWMANTFVPYALYAFAVFAASGVASIIMMVRTTKQYSNKR